MKKIEAIIRQEKLEDLKEVLDASFEANGMTVTQVLGCGKQKGVKEFVRGQAVYTRLLPKVKVDFIVADEDVETYISLITSICQTDEVGDGKIFVYNVEEIIRIRTNERGLEAL